MVRPPVPDPKVEPGWYETAFDDDYLARYRHRDRAEAERAVALALAGLEIGADFRAFDLACGAGRHLEFLRNRIWTTGGDLSAALLAQAPPPILRLDMRNLPLGDHSVHLVTNFFTAFGYFEDDAENFGVFAEVHRVLCPGGRFFFDFLNAEVARERVRAIPASQSEIVNHGIWVTKNWLSPDGTRALKRQQKIVDGRVAREVNESVRLFSRDEIATALERIGFLILSTAGDYDGGKFKPVKSERLIVTALRG